MTKKELNELADSLEKEAKRRRALGGYSTDADTLMLLSESLCKIAAHLSEKAK